MTCAKCGSPVQPGADFCQNCSSPLELIEPRSRTGRWLLIARDCCIVFGLSFAGGFVLTQIAASPSMLALSVTSGLLQTAGFVLCGSLVKGPRFKHLILVALGAWLLGSINIVLIKLPPSSWALGLPLIFAQMGLGGVLSLIVVRPRAGESMLGLSAIVRRIVDQVVAIPLSLLIAVCVGTTVRLLAGSSASITTGTLTGTIAAYSFLMATVPAIWFYHHPSRSRRFAACLAGTFVGYLASQIVGLIIAWSLGMRNFIAFYVVSEIPIAVSYICAFFISWLVVSRHLSEPAVSL